MTCLRNRGTGGQVHGAGASVNHIVFWQDYTLRSARGEKPDRETFAREVEQRNWEAPAQVDESSWTETKRRFRKSYVRALQGLPPIE